MRKCSYCKEPTHDIRKCPHKAKHIPLVRECAKLFFEGLFRELNREGIGPMSILKVKNKPHYFYSKESNEYIYEPNRSFGPGTLVNSLYDSCKGGSTNTFAITAIPFANSGLFGPSFTNAFPILRRMAEKMYYNLWAIHNYNHELSADMKRQKPKGMTDATFKKMLKGVYSRDKFIELSSLPFAPPRKKANTHNAFSTIYHKCDFREREVISINTPFLQACSLYSQRQDAALYRQLEAHDMERVHKVMRGEESAMQLLGMLLSGLHAELSSNSNFLQLSSNVEVISPSGETIREKQKNIGLAIDITEQQWYDITRSFIKKTDALIASNQKYNNY
jgi:hypothetical protein